MFFVVSLLPPRIWRDWDWEMRGHCTFIAFAARDTHMRTRLLPR